MKRNQIEKLIKRLKRYKNGSIFTKGETRKIKYEKGLRFSVEEIPEATQKLFGKDYENETRFIVDFQNYGLKALEAQQKIINELEEKIKALEAKK